MQASDLELIDRLFESGTRREREASRLHLRELVGEAAQNSALHNGRFHLLIAGQFISEYRACGEVLWDAVQRVLESSTAPLTPTTGPEIKQMLLDRLVVLWRTLDADLEATLATYRGGSALLARLGDAHRDYQVDLFARVDLRLRQVAASASAVAAPTAQHFHNSQIGAVISGSSNVAHVSMPVHVGDVDATTRAIDGLVTALQGSSLEANTRSNVIEMLGEMRTETSKPKPNVLRLASLATGASGAIQTAAAARPAYELLRTVLMGWGVNLPAWP